MLHRIIALAALFVLLVVALGGARASDAAPDLLPSILPITAELQYVEAGASLYAYDPRRELIYANGPDGILPITLSGRTLPPFAAGWNVVQMTISPDGEILYLLDWLKPSIVLIDLDTHALLDEWLLPTSRGAPAFGQTMVALPGAPAVLIARGGLGGALQYGIGVIDAEGLRPATVEALDSPHLQLSDDPNVAFGLFHTTLLVLHVDETGVSLTSSHNDLVGYSSFAYADGLLFGRDGALASAETFQRLGRFNTNGSVVPDVARGYAYYLREVVNEGVYLQAFDIATFRKVAEGMLTLETYETLGQADGLLRTGEDTYAILASSGVYLMRFSIHDQAIAIPLVANEFCNEFVEEFSGDSPYTWPVRDDAAGLVTIDNGELLVVSRTTEPIVVALPACYRPNYELTADVRAAGAEQAFYGLLYQTNGPEPHYDGVGGVVQPWRQRWAIDGYGTGQPSDVIHAGDAVNRLRIRVTSDGQYGQLSFYVNDVAMVEYYPLSAFHRGLTVGLTVIPNWDSHSGARFDNIRYRAIQPAP
jgi:hypothetical protein